MINFNKNFNQFLTENIHLLYVSKRTEKENLLRILYDKKFKRNNGFSVPIEWKFDVTYEKQEDVIMKKMIEAGLNKDVMCLISKIEEMRNRDITSPVFIITKVTKNIIFLESSFSSRNKNTKQNLVEFFNFVEPPNVVKIFGKLSIRIYTKNKEKGQIIKKINHLNESFEIYKCLVENDSL